MDAVPANGHSKRYPFLTHEVLKAIVTAVDRAMTDIRNHARTSSVYKDYKPKNVSQHVRQVLETCLRQQFAQMPNVEVTYIKNTFVLIFDGKWFMYLRKSDYSDTVFSDPKVLRNLQVKFYDDEILVQLPIPGLENEVGMAITDVYIISGLYVCDDATIFAGFYINQQENGVLTGSESIPLTASTIVMPPSSDEESDIDFSFKPDNNDGGSEGDQDSRASGGESAG